MSTTSTPDHLIRRVQALLAKAESTEFPHEAEAFLTKAQELITRHAIDDARLRRSGVRSSDDIITRDVAVDPPYAAGRTRLLHAVAQSNHCRLVVVGSGGGGRRCLLIGYDLDVDAVLVLFGSLSTQAARAMPITPPGDRPRRFRHAFLMAYAERVGARLSAAASAQQDEVQRDTGRSAALALRDRHDAVDRAVSARFPTLGTVRTSVSSGAGLASGRAAADRAALGGRSISRRPALPIPGSPG